MNGRELNAALAWDKAKGLYGGPVKVVTPSVTVVDPLDPVGIVKKLERCIRKAYKSEERITEDSWVKMISHILMLKHESTLEHVGLTFDITTNRGVLAELTRHRIGCSYTVESTRYVSYGASKKGGTVVYPSWLPPKTEDEKKYWYDGMVLSLDRYDTMLGWGMTPQEARGVLPNDLKTEIVWTANLRAIRHMLGLRLPPSAHPDMRIVAQGVLDLVSPIPLVFDSFKETHASPMD